VPFGIGPLELVLILVILVVIFGAKRLPELGRSLGSSARQFKKGVTGEDEDRATEALTGPPKPKDADHTG
jgi:sec-independent protein translocase protein TatA